ncbi:hypothetical protein BKA70DRAFT_1268680 [Coprinopsis sp. MPI-PUGE-AT-0042]|nr:hypothetical protein BKA70DRAFT_1268680 [Coprinopsis sp. MPI-PUGE-AT-0042]
MLANLNLDLRALSPSAMSESSDSHPHKRHRSSSHYYQNVVIEVEQCLYSIPKQALVAQSPWGDASGGEGESDVKPIVLTGYRSKDFDSLLKVFFYHSCSPRPFEPSPPSFEKSQWVSVLKLSTVWQIDKARTMAIEKLSALDLSPIEKIQHARDYRVSKWLIEGATALANSSESLELGDIASAVGWKTTALILSARNTTSKPKASGAEGWMKDWKCHNCDARLMFTKCEPGRHRLMCCGIHCTSGMKRDEMAKLREAVSNVFQEEIATLEA